MKVMVLESGGWGGIHQYAHALCNALALPQDAQIVLFFGMIRPYKGLDLLIRAMPAVLDAGPQALFVVAGKILHGEREEYERLIAEIGLEDCVVFTGFCDAAPGVFAALDVVVLTFDNEPFGRVLIEAMAAAKPVVATDGGGVPEIVVDGQTGTLVPIGDAQATAAAIAAFLDDSGKARAFGDAGQIRARDRFGIAAHVTQVEAVYAEILNDG